METTLKVKLISHTLNPELVIATAGKLCYSPSNIDDLKIEINKEEQLINIYYPKTYDVNIGILP